MQSTLVFVMINLLKIQTQCELQFARGPAAGCAAVHHGGDAAEIGGVEDAVGVAELGAVEDVEGLGAEVEGEALGEHELLLQAGVGLPEGGSASQVAAGITPRSVGGDGERREIEIVIDGAAAGRVDGAAHVVGALHRGDSIPSISVFSYTVSFWFHSATAIGLL